MKPLLQSSIVYILIDKHPKQQKETLSLLTLQSKLQIRIQIIELKLVPVSSFNTVAEQPHKIFVSYPPNSFHLHFKLLLCLTPEIIDPIKISTNYPDKYSYHELKMERNDNDIAK